MLIKCFSYAYIHYMYEYYGAYAFRGLLPIEKCGVNLKFGSSHS